MMIENVIEDIIAGKPLNAAEWDAMGSMESCSDCHVGGGDAAKVASRSPNEEVRTQAAIKSSHGCDQGDQAADCLLLIGRKSDAPSKPQKSQNGEITGKNEELITNEGQGKSDAKAKGKVMHSSWKSDAPPTLSKLNLIMVYKGKLSLSFTDRLVYSFLVQTVQQQQRKKQWAESLPSMRAIARTLSISQNATASALQQLEELKLIDPDHCQLLTPRPGLFITRKQTKGIPHWTSRLAYLPVESPHDGLTWRDMSVVSFLEFQINRGNNFTNLKYISISLGIDTFTVSNALKWAKKANLIEYENALPPQPPGFNFHRHPQYEETMNEKRRQQAGRLGVDGLYFYDMAIKIGGTPREATTIAKMAIEKGIDILRFNALCDKALIDGDAEVGYRLRRELLREKATKLLKQTEKIPPHAVEPTLIPTPKKSSTPSPSLPILEDERIVFSRAICKKFSISPIAVEKFMVGIRAKNISHYDRQREIFTSVLDFATWEEAKTALGTH